MKSCHAELAEEANTNAVSMSDHKSAETDINTDILFLVHIAEKIIARIATTGSGVIKIFQSHGEPGYSSLKTKKSRTAIAKGATHAVKDIAR